MAATKNTPPAEAPAVDTPPAEAPAVDTPPAEAPAVDTPPAELDGLAALQALGDIVAPLVPQELISEITFAVIALKDFGDALTKRDYQIGDLVPWRSRARAEKYAALGLVRIQEH